MTNNISYAQERLWFLDQLESGNPVYSISVVYGLEGPLNVAVLRQSLDRIVQRHKILRTNFVTASGYPVPIVNPKLCWSLPMVDLREVCKAERDAAARRLLSQERQHPFDLAGSPLLRTILLRLDDEIYILSLTAHRIVMDKGSIQILNWELGTLYQAFAAGKSSPLPKLPVQYTDFANWQRQTSQEALKALLTYWKQQLDSLPVLELPTDRPRPAIQTFSGAHLSLKLPQCLSQILKALSHQQGTTLFMTLLAAFKTLLHRYTGQKDIVIGSPITNCTSGVIQELIGPFANMLVLRTDLSSDPTFEDLLARVREVTSKAYAHQNLPFEKLLKELQLERNLGRDPLFQVTFEFRDALLQAPSLPGLIVTPLELESKAAEVDLALELWEQDGVLEGQIEYRISLFDAATIARMKDHFLALLDDIASNPQKRLSELSFLTQLERHQLLMEWNDTQTGDIGVQCLHHLFEAQAACTPETVAVVQGENHLTYAELNRRANQLAHCLLKLGAGPEVLLGLFIERSLEMMIGVLGVLKAGAAYVPLDAAYPKRRLVFMLQDAQVSLLLTQARLLEQLSQSAAQAGLAQGPGVICLDSDWDTFAITKESVENPTCDVTPENLAYVIYTSGSTGRPKGVLLQHRGLCNLVRAAIPTFAVGAGSRVLQFASFSFDASVEEIFKTLSTGASLCLTRQETLLSTPDLIRTLREQAITTVTLPPSLLKVLPAEGLPALRTVVSAGESCSPAVVARWATGRRFLNGYGPTEATVAASFYRVERISEEITHVSIGRPLANVYIYLLDAQMQPLPVGVPGELHIGGAGLARGYLRQSGLTAARFVPDPFSNEPGKRLYRTGDLARYRPDGCIEFLGRLDYQVKVRGFRIELGEIETVLRHHRAVRETVVVAWTDAHEDSLSAPGTDKRLVAYVVAQDEQELVTNELHSFLKTRLPNYMIPVAFVTLNALPLTSSGKVDRRALPAPPTARPEQSEAFVAPHTPTQEILAEIWSEVLKLDHIGIHDDFFELGGHSLMVTQVVSRVRQALQVEMSPRALFESPILSDLARAIETARQTAHGLRDVPLLPISRDQMLPLSFAQQRLWFLDQLEPDDPVYNVFTAYHLGGPLQVATLAQSLNEIVRRHEALRTNFPTLGGQAVQVIAATLDLKLSLVDLRQLAGVEHKTEAQRLAFEEAQTLFHLAKGPLLRATLLQMGDEEHWLLLTIHHIVFDGWSLGVLNRELEALYKAFATERPSPLSELSVQYADFAYWQRQWLQGEVLETQLTYWEKHLGGSLPMLELPTDRPRPAVQTWRGAHLFFELGKSLTRALKALSRQEGTTLFMTLLAAFKTLLYRYTGQPDILVGSPIANRNRAELETLIGFFVNTLVLRTDLSGDPTFRELLRRVRKVTLDAYVHQDLPFEKLVQVLQPERDLSHTPLFQVMFVFQDASTQTLVLPGLTASALKLESGTSKFDLTFELWEQEDELCGQIEYNLDLFDAATIARMKEHFLVLLGGIATHPKARLSELPLLARVEHHRLLAEWNDTLVECVPDVCVHHLFEIQVRHVPESVAVVLNEEHLTYAGLNRRANQLARYLRNLGVGPEVLVGLCVERCVEMAVGILGILKAGGAYVPLDPAYPKERLTFMLQDTRLPVLLTQAQLVGDLPVQETQPWLGDGPTVVCLDADWDEIAQQSREHPLCDVAPENLAYVIYTSGSTGRPKGVFVTHQNLVHSTNARICYYRQPVIAFLLLSSLSFDSSVAGVFWTLCQSGTLVLPPGDLQRDISALVHLAIERQVSHLLCVPSLYELVLAHDNIRQLSKMRVAIVAGESCSGPLTNQHHTLLPRVHLFNEYGPTEGTVWCSVYDCVSFQKSTPRTHVPIGRPTANAQLYLLDSNLQPVPIGVPGELHIAGAGLGRGYLNCPDLAAEKFMPHPFSNEPGSRLYKTGDLTRYLPDGNVEFLGRMDHQVKIHGYRIELGEIEAALGQHAAVDDNVLVAQDVCGDKRLVAYVILKKDVRPPTTSDWRRFLSKKLPDYMVPSTFVLLDALPLTPNGKIDRRALPVPSAVRPVLEKAFVAPRTSTEGTLAAIWIEVLKLDRVGVYDNFFELGGHSLLAVQVVSRLRDTFQVELPVQSLFETSTVAGLAASVEQRLMEQQADRQARSVLPLRPISRDEALQASFAQQRLWFLDQLDPGSPAYNIPAAFRLVGPLDVNALAQSLDEIVRRHEALRTTFTTVNGRPTQVIAPTLPLVLATVDLQELSETEREMRLQKVIATESRRSFDLARGPLFRTTLLRLGREVHVLLLVVHHIVSDGWSMGVLSGELSALYAAFCAGKPSRQAEHRPSPLPELPIQYADFASWQRQWLQGHKLEAQLAYWRRQLGGDLSVIELPTDYPRPAVQDFRSGCQAVTLSRSLTETLKTLSHREGVTLFMVLLAAFQTLLHRLTGQDDIVVGTPVAGRNRSEVEGLIGLFLNTLVLRVSLAGNPSFQELLARVHEVTLGAYAHQDVPFEKLVEELKPERDLSRNPLFDVMLNYANTSKVALEIPKVAVSVQELAEPGAKFSLTLYVNEAAGGLDLRLVYQRALFSDARMTSLLDQFRHLLEQIVADPQKPIQSYSLVTPMARALLPDPRVVLPEPEHELVTSLFLYWVEREPGGPAICQGGHVWTYGELAGSARTLAQSLRVRGLERGDVVAVSGPRTFGLIASMMSVLLSGCVLLTVDQNLPLNRQQIMLWEARAKYLLYVGDQQIESEWLQALSPITISFVDAEKGWILDSEAFSNFEEAPLPDLAPDDAAYLFFTSGTTGVPKGVLGCQKGLSHFLIWQRETFAIGPGDRCAQLTALSFDVVMRDIFLPLISGATLCLPEKPEEFGADQVLPWLERERISVIHAVPTLAQTWLADVPANVSLCSLRWVFFAGEPLPSALVQRWRETFPEAGRVVNLYGPTETTLAKCYYIVPDDAPHGIQPVGWPLSETQALVLARNDQMCGIGELGEIVIRTPFRSLGYVNAEEEGRDRFVKNPFRDDESDLLYYTGDRGRYRPDGSLEILGRLDEQVKIRGMRIEPAEVMAILARHPVVESCFIVAQKSEQSPVQLIAYVVKSKQNETSDHDLRRYLGQHVPAAMIPSFFVTLDALPLTSNGKIDRRALTVPGEVRDELEKEYVAPRTPVEQILAETWADVLGIESVGVHDNFFELGGDSLLIIQIIAQARQSGVQITPREFLQHQTIAGLAMVAGLVKSAQAEQGVVTGPVPILQAQAWVLEREPLELCHRNMALLFQAAPSLDAFLLERVVQQLLVHHDALRLRLVRDESGWRQFIVAPDEALPFAWVDLSLLPQAARGLTIEAAATQLQTSLNLSKGPIVRVILFGMGRQEPNRLLLIVHHLAADAASLQFLLKDLDTACQQLSRGEAIQLPPKTTSIKYWADRLVEYAQSKAMQQELIYWWAERWASAPRLPVDYPEGMSNNSVASARRIVVSLSKKETQVLLREVQKTFHVQTSEVLLTALAQAFARWTGERFLLVEFIVHGREGIFEDVDLSRTVGPFATNSLVLLELKDADTPIKALEIIKEQFRSVPQGGFGYGLLRYLNKDETVAKKMRALPRTQVCLNYMGQSLLEFSSLFDWAKESVGPVYSPRAERFNLLGISGGIFEGQLQFRWAYSQNIYKRATIERLAQGFVDALRAFVSMCQSLG